MPEHSSPGPDQLLVVATGRDLIEVEGPDAADFLQGQLSQDVAGLEIGQSAWSLLLQPQGKVDAWLRVTRLATDRFWLDLDAGYGAGAEARLRRFKLRVNCTLEAGTVEMVALRQAGAEGPGPALAERLAPEALPAGVVLADASWAGAAGLDLLVEGPGDGGGEGVVGPVLEAVLAALGPEASVGTEAELEALRIGLGVPAMGAELDETTIPAAAGIVEVSVDFTKGCYVGQELVARIDARGAATPTRLYGLRFDSTGGAGPAPAAGDRVEIEGAEAGSVTSSAANPPVALAYLKRGVAQPGAATVYGADGPVPATVVELPAP